MKTRTVTLTEERHGPITADFLLLALGSTSNFHHVPGVEQAAYTLKTLDDANGIRRNALELVKQAAEEGDSEARQASLTFVVAGGGYTGVEGIAALNELVRETAARYPSLKDTPPKMLIVEPLGRLMSEVTPDLAAYSQKQLEAAGVRVLLNVGIKSVDGEHIELANGEHVRARTLIWAAGVESNPLMEGLGVPTGKSKGVKVNGCLQVPSCQNVWALGDCAEVPEADGKGHYAPTAQNASREGKLAARNMLRALTGEPQQPFRYKPIGELAIVGRRRGVARIYNHNFSGLIAYLMWRGIYLMKMPSMAQRLRVLGDWFLDSVLGPAAEYRVASSDSGGGRTHKYLAKAAQSSHAG